MLIDVSDSEVRRAVRRSSRRRVIVGIVAATVVALAVVGLVLLMRPVGVTVRPGPIPASFAGRTLDCPDGSAYGSPLFAGGAGFDDPEGALAYALNHYWSGSKPDVFYRGDDERGVFFVGIDDGRKVAVVAVQGAGDSWLPGSVHQCTS